MAGDSPPYRSVASKPIIIQHPQGVVPKRATLRGWRLTRAMFSECYRRLCDFAVDYPKAFNFLELHHHAPYLDEESRSCDMIVELYGPPGSGKSTFARALANRLCARGYDAEVVLPVSQGPAVLPVNTRNRLVRGSSFGQNLLANA